MAECVEDGAAEVVAVVGHDQRRSPLLCTEVRTRFPWDQVDRQADDVTR
ncbi:hypothetical protein [Actinokineospora terrae]|nr:hypothetical protein [Actinokineospora terrae]